MPRFEKYGDSLGKEALKIGTLVHNAVTKLTARKKKMKEDMESIFEMIAEADSVESLSLATECLTTVLDYKMAEKDKQIFQELQKTIADLQTDVKMIESYSDNRKIFENAIQQYREKYSDENLEYDFIPVIEDCITQTKKKMDQEDANWRKRYLTLGNKSRQDVYRWKDSIKMLPGFLSDETQMDVQKLDLEADKIISDAKIEDVLQYFNKLSISEKVKCVQILTIQIQEDNSDMHLNSDEDV